MTDNQYDNDLVRRDFIAAYREKWCVTEERANSLMRHIETGASENVLINFYRQLCRTHEHVLLLHGGQVAAGFAQAIVEIGRLIPEEDRQVTVESRAANVTEKETP